MDLQAGRFAAGAVLLVAASQGAADAPSFFESWRGFDTGTYSTARFPWAGAVGDLDGDGAPDLVATNWPQFINPRLSLMRQDGGGAFEVPVHHAIGKPSLDVVLADFDGDGDLDVVCSNTGVNYEGSTVSLLRNVSTEGALTFQSQQSFSVSPANSGPVGLAAADFDRDGDIDLAVAKHGFFGNGNSVALLRNTGGGSFAAPSSYPAGPGPYKLTAVDLNGDGYLDLAVANVDQVMTVLMNTTAGGFAAPLQHAALVSVNTDVYQSIAAGDVDNDGDVDVVYSSSTTTMPGGGTVPAFALFRNNGNGVFAPAQGVPEGSYVAMALADVDENGWLDLLGASTSGLWAVVPGDGAGGFDAAQNRVSGEGPIDVRAADMDGDGHLDAVVFNRDSLEACVHRNVDGEGLFTPPASYSAATPFHDLDVGDVDGDGDVDVAVSYRTFAASGGVVVLANNGSGALTSIGNYPSSQAAFSVKLVDLSDDGRLDLLWADHPNAPPYDFKTRLNLGSGAFGPLVNWPVGTCGSSFVDAADLDADGDRDVVLIESLACQSIPTSSRRVFVVENVGSPQLPSFQLRSIIVIDVAPDTFVAADFNQDGDMDLAVSSSPVNILLGHGDLTFTIIDGPSASGAQHLVGADVSGDGLLDLVCGSAGLAQGNPAMGVLIGNGNATFDAPVLHVGSYSPMLGQGNWIAAGDADGDGDLDVLMSNYASNDASFYRNAGAGTFEHHVRYGLGYTPTDIVFADMTGDGVGDIVATIGTPVPLSGRVAVVRGVLPARAVDPADVNGDGAVDVADLVALIVAWGACPEPPAPCPADVDGSGAVDVSDLVLVLLAWG